MPSILLAHTTRIKKDVLLKSLWTLGDRGSTAQAQA